MINVRIGIIFLGILDTFLGICLLLTLILMQGISPLFILGLLYLAFSVGIFVKALFNPKILFYGISLFTLLSSLQFFSMIGEKVPEYYRESIFSASVFTGILVLFFIINLYFFTRQSVKNSS